MARKKIREYDSKRLLKEHLKRLSGIQLPIRSAQVTDSTNFEELAAAEPWISSEKLVVKPDMLFGKRGKSGLVALNLDLAQVAVFVKDHLGKEVEIGGCKGPVTTFIVEPFVPHTEEYYLNIVSERLGCSISFSECGGIEIEENWDKVKTVFISASEVLTPDICAPLLPTIIIPPHLKGGGSISSLKSLLEQCNNRKPCQSQLRKREGSDIQDGQRLVVVMNGRRWSCRYLAPPLHPAGWNGIMRRAEITWTK